MGLPDRPPTRAMSADDVPAWLKATHQRLRGRDVQGPTPEHDAWPVNEMVRLREQNTRALGFAPNRAFMVCGRPVVASRCRNVHRHSVVFVCAASGLACHASSCGYQQMVMFALVGFLSVQDVRASVLAATATCSRLPCMLR